MVFYRIQFAGRLGNLLTAMINMMFVAEKTGESFSFNEIISASDGLMLTELTGRVFIPNVGIVEGEVPNQEECIMLSMADAYYQPRFIATQKEKLLIARKYIYQFLPQVQETRQLVIHIRSGDIFEGTVHSNMMQPPLSYYRYILNNGDFQDATVVAENMSNPVISQLIKEFPYLRVQLSSVEEDTRTVLSAKHLVVGTGSFAHMLSIHSPQLECLYCFSNHNLYYPESTDYGYKIKVYTSDGYPINWNGDATTLTQNWDIRELSMEGFVERPRAVWDL